MILDFTNSDFIRNSDLFQYDYGQTAEIKGVEIDEKPSMHFQLGDIAEVREIKDIDGKYIVEIPDICLQQNVDFFYAWVYNENSTSGETVKTVQFTLNRREKPTDMPTDLDVKEVKEYAEYVKENAEKVAQAEQTANKIKEMADSGAFDGADGNGIDRIEKVSTSGLVDTYRIYFTDGTTYDYTVTNGKDGSGGGTGGTSDYNDLENKPSINGVSLEGNKTLSDLGIDVFTPREPLDLSGTTEDKPYNILTAPIGNYDVIKTGYAGNSEKGILFETGSILYITNYDFAFVSQYGSGYISKVEINGNNFSDSVYNATLGDIANKVDKIDGKGLSTNDFTDEDKQKVENALTEIPLATETTIGGVKLPPATEDMTQPVGIGEDGKAYTAPSGGSGGQTVYTEKLIARYVHTSNKEIKPTALDLETGIFTCKNHGLDGTEKLMPCSNTLNFKSVTVIPQKIFLNYQQNAWQGFIPVVIDENTFKLKLSSGEELTFDSSTDSKVDVTKFWFEPNNVKNIVISSLPDLSNKKVKVCVKNISHTFNGIGFNLINENVNKNYIYWTDTSPTYIDVIPKNNPQLFTNSKDSVILNTNTETIIDKDFATTTVNQIYIPINQNNYKDNWNTEVKYFQFSNGIIGDKPTYKNKLEYSTFNWGSIQNGLIIEIYEMGEL